MRISALKTSLGERYFGASLGGRARLATFAGFASRGALIVIAFVTLPISIGYLGNEGYGLLLTITSVVGWLQLTTLGVAPGFQNALTEQIANGDPIAQARLVSTACFTLLAIAGVVGAIGLAIFPFVDWRSIFPPASSRFLDQIAPAVAVVFACFCGSVAVMLVPPILAARQELHLSHVASLASGVSGLVILLVTTRLDYGLPGVAFATSGAPVVIGVAFAFWLMLFRGVEALRPRLAMFSRPVLRQLVSHSIGFLILGISNIAIYNTDVFILAHFAGTAEVAPYGVAQRFYAQFATLFGIVAASLWPAYGHAKATGNVEWIRRTYLRMRNMQAVAFMALLASLILVGNAFFSWWVGKAAAPETTLIAMLGVVFIVHQWAATHSMMLNGLGVVRRQVPCLLIQAALLITLGIVGTLVAGAIGLASGLALAYIATTGWYLPALVHTTLSQMENK